MMERLETGPLPAAEVPWSAKTPCTPPTGVIAGHPGRAVAARPTYEFEPAPPDQNGRNRSGAEPLGKVISPGVNPRGGTDDCLRSPDYGE